MLTAVFNDLIYKTFCTCDANYLQTFLYIYFFKDRSNTKFNIYLVKITTAVFL